MNGDRNKGLCCERFHKTILQEFYHPLRAMEGGTPWRVVPGSLRAGCFSEGKI
ncbi:hypothetical protein LDG_5002 [Legionella drancourtii LLAP12]|uniref:Uncharacterized protein n=1 Tax=Legionella drancourtii LLAP12 TaxID=658187 RepID=G9EIJ7_9GAMM|nr:hypothetical protein LDG_5002 [Legionella drancourtii LLAP12]